MMKVWSVTIRVMKPYKKRHISPCTRYVGL